LLRSLNNGPSQKKLLAEGVMTQIVDFWRETTARLLRTCPGYGVVSFTPAAQVQVLSIAPVWQDPGSETFLPITDPKRYDHDADGSEVVDYSYSFEFAPQRTWVMQDGVDWGQGSNMPALPPLVAGAPTIGLTLSEGQPVSPSFPKKPYSDRMKIEVPAHSVVMVTSGLRVTRPQARWRGELVLNGHVSYVLRKGNTTLTGSSPLDRLYTGDPHPAVTVHGPGTVGILISIYYEATEPSVSDTVVQQLEKSLMGQLATAATEPQATRDA
jgi:hypothetical protein